ncbi:hypothetical protein WAF17_16325 [Bernardetia sp. ABR2-2B]|uniref:hypothetical protein n=1 Tax=Bernardetia sp. ABR2-2B TaxID=3127472 RepID=UPI0030D4A692
MDKNKTKRPFAVQVINKGLPAVENFDSNYAYFGFRLFSADSIIGADGWNCSYCPKEVLQEAAHKWNENVLRLDHRLATKELVGTISQVWFDDGTIQDGVRIPSGVNGYFKINRTEFSKEVELLQSDPAGIRYTSAGISFEFEPSHEFEDDWDFWRQVGKTINGEYVHFKITNIEEVFEQSLVWEGADPCAVRLEEENDEVIFKYLKENRVLDDSRLQSLKDSNLSSKEFKTELKKEMPKGIGRFAKMTFGGNPSAGKQNFSNTEEKSAKDESQNPLNPLDDTFGEGLGKIMSEEEEKFKSIIEKKEQKQVSLEQQLKEKTSTITRLQVEVEEQKEEVAKLKTQLDFANKKAKDNEEFATLSKKILEKQRSYAKEVYTKQGKELPSSIENIIDKADFETLDDLIVDFGGKSMTAYGQPKCSECGSQKFVIRNSEHTDLPDERKGKTSNLDEALDNFNFNQTIK